jgi:uncharacterized protein
MGRLFLLVVLAVVAIWLIRRAMLQASRADQGGSQPGAPAAEGKTQGDLVKCAHCGMHLPLAEARAVGDRLYCSDEHARLGPGRS